jgi:hypothetical protein
MGLTVKTIDPKSSLRKLEYNVFGGTASNNIIYLQVPFACTYDKAIFGRGVASAACIVDISNVTNSSTVLATTTTIASASGLPGSIVKLSATANTFITANSLLKVTISGTTTEGALMLFFSIDENKEK